MKEQLDELIRLAYDYQKYGASIRCRQNWIKLYGSQTEVLPYKPNELGSFTVETYFADRSNYNTFVLRITINDRGLSISEYSKKIEIPFSVTEDFLKLAVEKLTLILDYWKEHTANVGVDEVEQARQQEIDELKKRLEELENGTATVSNDDDYLPF